MSTGPKARYEALIESGAIEPDARQREAIERLDALSGAVARYEKKRGRWFSDPAPPKGLYLWGGVGRGKTMLMDIFFNQTPARGKRRAHFHAFMNDVHERIAAWRAADAKTRRRHRAIDKRAPDDPIGPVAHDLAEQARLLCFDELQVCDIADAMILSRLFEALFQRGVVVVATSNRRPDDLYKDGLNRQLFTPFIDRLKARTEIFELDARKDYRLEKLTGRPVYYCPLGPAADAAMDEAWEDLKAGAEERACALSVKGRDLRIARVARGAGRMTFDALCARPLGPGDYAAIADALHTLFIDRIPVMDETRRNEARRFVSLIDVLYETRAKLVCSADAEPSGLYVGADGAFEFERAASRLIEMRGRAYLAAERRAPETSDLDNAAAPAR